MKEKILGLLFAVVGLITVSCTQNWEIPEDAAEEIAVTFSISTEGQMIRSRAGGIAFGENGEKKRSTISDGKKVDRVVYALYIYDAEKGSYRRLDQFGDNYGKSDSDINRTLGPGQALLHLTDDNNSKLLGEGETLTLRLMRGQEYVIAFWAQNSSCTAYNTENLEAVVVDYTAGNAVLAPNNDEIRDAFCVAMSFTATVGKPVDVVLKRAMAQINVGTAGWDYNAEVVWGNCYAYSKAVMTGIKNQLNVLTGELDTAGDFDGTVTYDWAKLPAYNGIEYPSAFPEEGKYQDFAAWLKDSELDKEFLYVKLRDDTEWSDYTTVIPEKFSEQITEVFKYLSMCYVLAPVAPQREETSQVQNAAKVENEETSALVINQFDFYLAESIPTGTEDGTQIFSITQVPFQRNWRTNILGGVRGSETSLFDPHAYSLKVDIRPCYFDDEHNYKDPGPDVGNEEHSGDIFPAKVE